MKILTLLLLALLLFSTCKKEYLPYRFTGNVSDNNGNAVPGVTVELFAYYRGGILGGGGLTKVASTTTNASGNFSKNFTYPTGPEFFEVSASSKDYYPFYKEHIRDTLPNNLLVVNPVVNKYSTIRIMFKNVAPFNSSDIISFGHSHELGGPHSTFIERKLLFGTYNPNYDEYVSDVVEGYEISRTKGDTYTVIQWRTHKNGIYAGFMDSIFISGGTQAIFTLNY